MLATTDSAIQPSLEQLEQQQLIWRGSQASGPVTVSTSGWPELDRQLGGGLPASGIVSVQSRLGIGELRLFMPFWRRAERLLVFIGVPYPLNAESLQGADLDLSRVLVLTPKTEKEALWAAEQCLKSGACQSVALWQSRLTLAQARRLQLAAREGKCTQFLFLGPDAHAEGLPVDLALALSPHPSGIAVQVPKRKQGWALPRFTLDMAELWPELTDTTVRGLGSASLTKQQSDKNAEAS